MSKQQHRCCGRIMGSFHSYQCSNIGRHEHEGQWYCATHHPDRVAERTRKSNERMREKWAEQKRDRELFENREWNKVVDACIAAAERAGASPAVMRELAKTRRPT